MTITAMRKSDRELLTLLVADALEEHATWLRENHVPHRLKVEDGLEEDTPIPLDDKAIERLTS